MFWEHTMALARLHCQLPLLSYLRNVATCQPGAES